MIGVKSLRTRTLASPGPLGAVGLGALSVAPFCFLDWPVAGASLGATLLGGSALSLLIGGGAGLLTRRLRVEPWLTLLLAISPWVLGASSVYWLLRRAAELELPILRAYEAVAVLGCAVAVFALVARTLPRSIHLRHAFAAAAAAGIALVVLEPMHGARGVVAVVVPLLLWVCCALALATRLTAWFWPMLLACAAYAALARIEGLYTGLRGIVVAALIGASLLSLRRLFDKLSSEPAAGKAAVGSRAGTALAIGSLCAAAIVSSALTRPSAGALRLRGQGRGLQAALVTALRASTDFDADGYGIVFGNPDCAPFSSSIHPGLHEVPDNGVDDNCVQGDSRLSARSSPRAQMALHDVPPPWSGNIVIVLIDALRQDATLAPELSTFRALREQGVVFERAYATATHTVQSLAGILAGRLPSTVPLYWSSPHDAYPKRVPITLFDRLQSVGFDIAIAGGLGATARGGIFTRTSYGRGARVLRTGTLKTSPSETNALALEAFRTFGERRWLLYVHYMAAHASHGDPQRYRAAVREIDAALGSLRRTVGQDAMWVILADHGESFGLHGHAGHSVSLDVGVAHVPLMVIAPNLDPRREAAVTSLLMITPTIVAMAAPQLAPLGKGPYLCLAGPPCLDSDAPMALERRTPHLHSLIRGSIQIVHDLNEDLITAYDLAHDPEQLHPLRSVPADALLGLRFWEEHAATEAPGVHWPYESP